MQSTKFKLIFAQRFMSSAKSIANHYNALGVTPSATQMEIKTAYYKLSKLYHPDVNNDAAAAKKFREINEAYEVIGNIKLKKLYDKGGLNRADYRPSHQESADGKKYAFRSVRPRTPGIQMETIYDFDSWTKEHYGKTFERQFQEKRNEHTKSYAYKNEEGANAYIALLLITLMGAFIVISFLEDDLDTVKRPSNDGKQ